MYFINNLEQIFYIKKLKYKINKIYKNRVKECMAAETKQNIQMAAKHKTNKNYIVLQKYEII